MKILRYRNLAVLFLLTLATCAKAQVNIDETNLITRLSGLNNSNVADAGKYFTDHGYTIFSKQTVPQAKFSMDLYKYKLKGQTNSYILMVIAGGVSESGYITYEESEYGQAVKSIKSIGFVQSEAAVPGPAKTVYTKGNLSFVIEQHTAGNKTFYVMMLSDLLKTAQLAGLKK